MTLAQSSSGSEIFIKRQTKYGEGMKIYVIVLNWNGKDGTLGCLYSLTKIQTPHEPAVFDNVSTETALLRRFPTCFRQPV
ncbi:MAG: hypothetical protein AAGE99_04860 [Chlamydiota bacterium]